MGLRFQYWAARWPVDRRLDGVGRQRLVVVAPDISARRPTGNCPRRSGSAALPRARRSEGQAQPLNDVERDVLTRVKRAGVGGRHDRALHRRGRIHRCGGGPQSHIRGTDVGRWCTLPHTTSAVTRAPSAASSRSLATITPPRPVYLRGEFTSRIPAITGETRTCSKSQPVMSHASTESLCAVLCSAGPATSCVVAGLFGGGPNGGCVAQQRPPGGGCRPWPTLHDGRAGGWCQLTEPSPLAGRPTPRARRGPAGNRLARWLGRRDQQIRRMPPGLPRRRHGRLGGRSAGSGVCAEREFSELAVRTGNAG